MRTNAKLLTPQIEKLFTYENDDKITGALVDAVVEKVNAGLITEANGANLLFVDRLDSSRKSLFHLAKESNWKTIAKWYNRYHEACSWMIERASTATDLERFVTWVRDGDWEDKDMGRRLLMSNKQGVAALSLLDFQTQQEVALWNKEATAQAAHLMPAQFIDWLVEEARQDKFTKEDVGGGLNIENKDGVTALSLRDVQSQREVALWNKKATTMSIHLMPLDFQVWVIEQARQKIFEKADVCEGLLRLNKEKALSLSLLDQASQQEVAHWNKKATASTAYLMPLDFQVWLIEQARQGIFEKADVCNGLLLENKEKVLSLSLQNQVSQQEVALWNKKATTDRTYLMPLDFQVWLIEQARQDIFGKADVCEGLFQTNKENLISLSLLDFQLQQEVALWNKKTTIKFAHLMPLDFKVWLIEQARLDIFDKADVCEGLCQENKQEVVSLTLLNQAIQQEVALWNKKAIAAKAHLMPLDFQVWVIDQARQDIFEKKDVADMLYKRNLDNKLVLSTLQFSLQKQVANFDPIKTCQSVALMDEAFNEWLYCEAENHRWEQTSVFRVLKKEKVDGKTVVSAIVKPGIMICLYVDCSPKIFFSICSF